MPNTVRLHRVLAAKPERVYKAFLDPEGKSGNAAFNSAVLRSIKEASGMEQPVPPHLKQMLVEQGACVTFKY